MNGEILYVNTSNIKSNDDFKDKILVFYGRQQRELKELEKLRSKITDVLVSISEEAMRRDISSDLRLKNKIHEILENKRNIESRIKKQHEFADRIYRVMYTLKFINKSPNLWYRENNVVIDNEMKEFMRLGEIPKNA